MAKIKVSREAAPRPSGAPASAILLHGLYESGENWRFVAKEAPQIPQLMHIDFILPSAPHLHITAFNQYLPGWFDIIEYKGKAEDVNGIRTTMEIVRGLVQAEIERGVPPDRIVLGGFSQGGVITAASVLTLPEKLAGFIIMSGWLPIEAEKIGNNELNVATPVLELHGTSDDVVPYSWGTRTADAFRNKYNFKNLEFKTYQGSGHLIRSEATQDLLKFLSKTLPAN